MSRTRLNSRRFHVALSHTPAALEQDSCTYACLSKRGFVRENGTKSNKNWTWGRSNWSLAPMQLVHMCRSVAPMQLVLLKLEQDSCTYALVHVYPSAVLFEIIAQIQRKTGHGVETPPPRSFWCVCTCLCELICLSLVLGQPTANFTQCS